MTQQEGLAALRALVEEQKKNWEKRIGSSKKKMTGSSSRTDGSDSWTYKW